MKKSLFLGLLALGTFANASECKTSKTLYSCLINRSVSIQVIKDSDSCKNTTTFKLAKSHFMRPNAQVALSLDQPTVVEAKNKLIILENRGRSGYVSINIGQVTTEDGRKVLQGVFDISVQPDPNKAEEFNSEPRTLSCIKQ